jgi:hypothetical protein
MGGAMVAIASAVAIMGIGIGAATAAGVMDPVPTEAVVSARVSGLRSAAVTATAPSHRIRPLWRAPAPCRGLRHHQSRVPSAPRAAHAAVAGGVAGDEAVAVASARARCQRM